MEKLITEIRSTLPDDSGSLSDFYIMALRQYDPSFDVSAYMDTVRAYIAEHDITSATQRQRIALALVACGYPDDAFVLSAANDTIGTQGITSWIFGLHLLNNRVFSTAYSKTEVITQLLSMQKEDGGWALTGDFSDTDITAMVLQALAPHVKTDDAVRCAADKALKLLSAMQSEDGNYQSFGEKNPESTAQVLVALSALGIDQARDERFIKSGKTLLGVLQTYRLDDGTYCHTVDGASNATATTQVFYSLVSLSRLYRGEGSLYLFDRTESAAEPATAVSYKTIAYIVIAVLVFMAIVILLICKKCNLKNSIFVLLAGVLCAGFVFFTDFQSTAEYYQDTQTGKEAVGSVTITIRCDRIVGMSDSQYIPQDGVILPVSTFAIDSDDTVYDILTEAAKKYGIQIENDGLSYISGINYLYACDFGNLSGWVYHVNGIAPSVGCGEYRLSDGDRIEWLYTCNLGEDVK